MVAHRKGPLLLAGGGRTRKSLVGDHDFHRRSPGESFHCDARLLDALVHRDHPVQAGFHRHPGRSELLSLWNHRARRHLGVAHRGHHRLALGLGPQAHDLDLQAHDLAPQAHDLAPQAHDLVDLHDGRERQIHRQVQALWSPPLDLLGSFGALER